MKSSQVLKEMNELKVAWRKQNLSFNGEQRKRYDELLDLRRQIVGQFYKEGRVYVKPSAEVLKKEEEEKTEKKAAQETEE
jgi:hypothetical protein